jgi:hypothetical protein
MLISIKQMLTALISKLEVFSDETFWDVSQLVIYIIASIHASVVQH